MVFNDERIWKVGYWRNLRYGDMDEKEKKKVIFDPTVSNRKEKIAVSIVG
jgi:hypothetical protein